jgi:transcriptional regulator of acetoin/glycerol metabolism
MKPIRTLADVERELIVAALEELKPVEAAKALGIGKTTIYRKLKKYGIDADALRTESRLDI